MEDLTLVVENEMNILHIETLNNEKACITIYESGHENCYLVDKEEAKQIVGHLTKVFEL